MAASRFTEWLPSAAADCEKAKQLRAKVDDEHTPFKSKYEAIDIYQKLLNELESLHQADDDKNYCDRYWLVCLVLNFECGITNSDTEDLQSAERHFQKCIDICNGNLNKPLIVETFSSGDEDNQLAETTTSSLSAAVELMLTLINISLYNQLGFLKCLRTNYKASVSYLKESEKSYYNWEKQEPNKYCLTIEDVIKLDANISTFDQMVESCLQKDVNGVELKKAHIMSVYFLAQAYQQTDDFAKSAQYCHLTLKLQYNFLSEKDTLIDHIEWALYAATLSQFFASNDQYDVARHFLSCARMVLAQTEPKKIEEQNERFKKAGADLDRVEVKYCLMILDESVKLRQSNEIDRCPPSEYQFRAYLINDDSLAEREQKFPSFPARNYDDAKQVFRYALNAINSAKQFFTLEQRCSDYISCILDQSQIYASLISYIPEIENRCKIVKRRIDLLEELDKELNSQYYLQHCRQIWYELGNIYGEQVSLKQLQNRPLIEGETTGGNEVMAERLQALKKINMLIAKSILHYHKFLNSFDYLNKNKKKFNASSLGNVELWHLPERIEDADDVKPILTAYLSIGHSFTKLVMEPVEERNNWMKCEAYLTEIKSYCTRNEDQRQLYFEDYYIQMEEMLRLIPGKIQNIMSRTLY